MTKEKESLVVWAKQSPEKAKAIHQGLREAGIDFVVTVPDSWTKEVSACLRDDPDIRYVCVTREEEAVAVAAGAWLGGKQPALLIESTGLGNSLTALGGLNLDRQIPVLILTSFRSALGEMLGQVSSYSSRFDRIMEALGVPYFILRDAQEAGAVIKQSQAQATCQRIPVAIFLTASAMWDEK